MERKTYVWSLVAGAIGGAAVGVLIVLAYRKWSGTPGARQQSEKIGATARKPVQMRHIAQVGVLGFQLLRELAQMMRRDQA